MSEKPILFNTNMVRAILDGRKRCTRRVVKGYIPEDAQFGYTGFTPNGAISCRGIFKTSRPGYGEKFFKLPYQPGDILYVWLNEFRYVSTDKEPYVGWNYSWGKRPSIHMPKEAARIWLKVTNVKVERLQEITEDGAESEGAIDSRGFILSPDNEYNRMHTAREHFTEIWNSTIKKSDLDRYGWDANPWVWVIEFDRHEKPGKR